MTDSRSKGKRAERDVVRYLEGQGWAAKRRLSGNGQAGDIMIAAAPHVVLDVKDRPEPRIVSWLEQLDDEADGRDCQALVWKPWSKGADPGQWLAVVANHPLDQHRTHAAWTCDLNAAGLRAVLGWLDVEHDTTLRFAPSLDWFGADRDWWVMRFSSFVRAVLPEWSDDAKREAS